jgi:hypothetical protein
MLTRFALAALGIALAASATAAQAPVAAPRQSIAINPLGAVFRVYSGEIERSLVPGLSLGASSSYWGTGADFEDGSGDVSYLSLDGKLRYYPGGTSLQGFSLGGTFGYTRLAGKLTTDDGRETGRADALSAGVVLDYNWLLGDDRRFLVGTGVGAKRLFPLGIEDADVSIAYPTLRLSVGYAF